MTQKGPLSNTPQTDSEIETVLHQLVPASESLAPAPAPVPAPESLTPAPAPAPAPAPPPESRVPRRVFTWARSRPGLTVLAVVASLGVAGRCAYLQHKLSELSNEAAVAKAEARARERRMQRPIPNDAANETGLRSDLEDASRRISGVGPIHQTAPGVFTNRDSDPAEMPAR